MPLTPHFCPQSPWGAAILDLVRCPHLRSLSTVRVLPTGWDRPGCQLPTPALLPLHAGALVSESQDCSPACLPCQPLPWLSPWPHKPGFSRLEDADCPYRFSSWGLQAGPGGGVLRI